MLAQSLGKAAINLAVFLFGEDRKSKDLPFGEIDKSFHVDLVT